MRTPWAKPILILAALLPLQACGSPEGNALAASLLGAVAQTVLTGATSSGPAPGGSASGGSTGSSSGGTGTGSSGGSTGSSSGGTGTGNSGGSTGSSPGGTGTGNGGGSTTGGASGTGLNLPGLNIPGANLPGVSLGNTTASSGGGNAPNLAPGLPDGRPTADEQELLNLLRAYRATKGLPNIPTSKAMMIVAQAHAADLDAHPPDRSAGCNMHSWSSHGPWKAVCYTSDHAKAEGMWRKPQELGTGYPGNGYEISYGMSGAKPTAQDALDGWISSSGHHAVMINEGTWKDNTWQAVGAGMAGGYAVMWFGEEADPNP